MNEVVSETEMNKQTASASWLHRLSVLAVCLVWPLIWVGGLVTTYDAGMAVPDWPGTYGYNLFLYPISTWMFGPFDLFIEHGHRLLGALVGLVAIAMVVTAVAKESRRWVLCLAIGILLAVISQGALGGARVLLGDRTLAMIHGCFGPVVFVLCAIAATVTSRRWTLGSAAIARDDLGAAAVPVIFAALPVVLSYMQLVLGAQLRHVQPLTTPGAFTHTVATHIVTGLALWLITPILFAKLRKCGDLTLSRRGGWLIGFVGLQILLGIGTWTVKYGWPSVLRFLPFGEGFVVRSKGFVESMIVTAHVAVGSLILATSAVVFVQALRRRMLVSLSKPHETESHFDNAPGTETAVASA